MIYIVNHDTIKAKEFIEILKNNQNIKFTQTKWQKIQNIEKGLLIVFYTPLESRYLSILKNENKTELKIILLTAQPAQISQINIIALPTDTNPLILYSLTHWIHSNCQSSICSQVLNTFFFQKQFQTFFLDNEDKILFAMPENESFLGCLGKVFHGKTFKEVFGISSQKIPFIEETQQPSIYHLIIKNKKSKINVFKIRYNRKKIPGGPEETETILFLNQTSEINNTDSTTSTSHLEKKAIELLVTNEIYQVQAKKIKSAFIQLNQRNKQFLEELSLASDLQKSLLPRSFPGDIGLNFTHKYLPHTYIGGDFFDVIRLDQNKIGIIIADVSGHGVSAAFITAMFKTAFNHFKELHLYPRELMKALNQEFSETIHTEHYITAFYAVLDLITMKCEYSNAGHPKQLLFRKNGEILELTTEGFFIGMFDNTVYEQKQTPLYPGDRLVFYTDGIIEITNDKQELYGRENVKKIIENNKEMDIESISNILMSSLVMYMNEIAFTDDITILITELIENI